MKYRYLTLTVLLTSSLLCYTQIKDAHEAMGKYRYREAIELLQNLPETTENLLLKASCYRELYDYPTAIGLYEKVIEKDARDISTIVTMAECQNQAGDMNASLKYWTKAADLSPENLFLQIKKTIAHYRANDWQGTIESADIVFASDSVPMLLRMVGDAYAYSGDGSSAILFYNKAIQRNPADHLAVSKLGNLYIAAKFYDAAIEVTDNYLLQVNDEQKTIGQLNGMAHYSAGNSRKAIKRLKKNVLLGDSTYTTHYYLGMSFYASKIYPEASIWLEKAYDFNDKDYNLLYYFGTALTKTSERKRGISILQEGIDRINEINEKLYDFDFSLGNAYLNTGEYRKSVQHFKSSYARQPDKYQLLYNIAYAYDSMKDYKNAIDYYQQFLKSKPKHVNLDEEMNFDTGEIRSVDVFYQISAERVEALKKEKFFRDGKK